MKNQGRREALADAAIETLAEHGARGLTFRAVDARAEVPAGTASNYFASRDDLLITAARRVYERLSPGATAVDEALDGRRDRNKVEELVRAVVGRITAFPSGYLALLELRLESTRRPELRALLTERVRADIDGNLSFHVDHGLPGGRQAATVLYLAINWLIVELLTLPDAFAPDDLDTMIGTVVDTILHAHPD